MDKYPVFEAPNGDKRIKITPDIELWDNSTSLVKSLIKSVATAARNWTFPNKDITVAGLDDIKVVPVFIQTANKNFSNTTTETSLVGTGVGSVTIPANSLKVGDVIKISMKGVFSRVTGNHTVRSKFGSNSQNSSTITPNTTTNGLFEFEVMITIRSIGASGTAISQGKIKFYQDNADQTGSHFSLTPQTAPFTIDTTAAIVYDLTYQFTSANASNSITSTNLLITKTSA